MNDAPRRSNQLRHLVPVLVLAASFCVSQPAHAVKRAKLMVLQFQSDDLDENTRAAATKALRERASKDARFTLMDTPQTDFFELMMDAECTDVDAACLVGIGKKLGAQRLLYASGKKADGGAKVTLMFVNVSKGKAIKTADGTAGSAAKIGVALGQLADSTIGPLAAPKPSAGQAQAKAQETVACAGRTDGKHSGCNGLSQWCQSW